MDTLIELIKTRQSTRTAFDPEKPVSREFLRQIIEAGAWAPTAHNMQNYEVVVVDDKTLLDRINRIDFPPDPTFIQENYLQLSFSEEELRRKKTGVLATPFPKSWRQPGLIPERARDIGLLQPRGDETAVDRHNHLLPCPTLVLLLYDPSRRAPASEGDFLGVMSLGCVLENMWLMAQALGIGFHVVSALSGPIVQTEVKRILGIPPALEIALSFRLGYPTARSEYLRVRRDVDSFTHYNGFAGKNR